MTVRNVADQLPATAANERVLSSLLEMPIVVRGETGRRGGFVGPVTAPEIRGGQWHHRVVLSPGAVQLTTCRRPGWEPRKIAPAELRSLVRELSKIANRLWVFEQLGTWADSYRVQDGLIRRQGEIRDLLDLVKRSDSVRSDITAWSRKSQRRMVRRIATLDHSVMSRPGWVKAMVTLTYPGRWEAFAPDGGTAKRHLKAFRAWWARRTEGLDMGIWKLEFQKRGSPHFHLLLMVPENPFHRSTLDGLPQDSFADECRLAWWRIISRDVAVIEPDRVHLRVRVNGDLVVTQGVNIDLSEGSRMTDPARIAAYFEKHGRYGGKEYQHDLPAAWIDAASGDDQARPGRWWGYWKLDPVEISGEISKDDTVEFRRLMRSWVAAQGVRPRPGAPVEPRAFQRTVWRNQAVRVSEGHGGVWHAEPYESTDKLTGELLRGRKRRRRVRRRFEIATLRHPVPTGYVLVNDAPALLAQVGRALVEPPDPPPDFKARALARFLELRK